MRATGGEEAAAPRRGARRPARRRLPLAAQQGHPRGRRAPARRARLRGSVHGPQPGAPAAALRRDAVAHPADGRQRAVPRPRLPLLLAHRGGRAVSDPLPPQGVHGRARGDAPRRQSPRRGQAVHERRRQGGEPGRQPPGVHHRRERLPAVPASGSGSAHGRRRPDALLLGRGSADEAQLPGVPPRAGRSQRRSRLRREGRPFQRLRLEDAGPRLPHPRERQPHVERAALPAGRAAAWRLEGRGAARTGAPIRPGPPRGHVLDPDQRLRPKLPPGDGARERSRPRQLEGGRTAPGGGDAGRTPALRGLLRAVRARGGPAPSARLELRRSRIASRRVRRRSVPGPAPRQPRVRCPAAALRLPIPDRVALRLRLRPEDSPADAAQADRGPRRLRRVPVSRGADPCGRRGRRLGADLDGLSQGPDEARRHEPRAALRLWLWRPISIRPCSASSTAA